MRADSSRTIPNSIGVPPIPYLGSAYLGPAHEPFAVHGDPNDPLFAVPLIGLKDQQQIAALDERVRLHQRLDAVNRNLEQFGKHNAFDESRTGTTTPSTITSLKP